jgi:hypothetical protein
LKKNSDSEEEMHHGRYPEPGRRSFEVKSKGKEEMTRSGIVMPDTVSEKPQGGHCPFGRIGAHSG